MHDLQNNFGKTRVTTTANKQLVKECQKRGIKLSNCLEWGMKNSLGYYKEEKKRVTQLEYKLTELQTKLERYARIVWQMKNEKQKGDDE